MFVRSISRKIHGTPEEMAQKCIDNRVTWVVILTVNQTGPLGHRSVNRRDLLPYANALRQAGVDIWVWGFPVAGQEALFVEALVESAEECSADGVMIDPEVHYKGRPANARRLVSTLVDRLDGVPRTVATTSYPVPGYHRTLPWEEFAELGGMGCPQCYTVSARTGIRGMSEWRGHGWDPICPVLPLFGPRSEFPLEEYSSRILSDPRIHSCLFWSWRQASDLEWETIRTLSARLRSRTRTSG